CLGAVLQAELAEDVADVAFDGALAHHEGTCDLLVAAAVGEQPQHLALSFRQLRPWFWLARRRHLLHEPASHFGVELRLAGLGAAHRLVTVTCLPDHLDVGLQFEVSPQTFSDHTVVVHDQDADGLRFAGGTTGHRGSAAPRTRACPYRASFLRSADRRPTPHVRACWPCPWCARGGARAGRSRCRCPQCIASAGPARTAD